MASQPAPFTCGLDAHVEHCSYYGWADNTIHIAADVGGDEEGLGNANGFVLEKLCIQHCGKDGVFASGGDANAGSGTNLDIMDFRGWAVNDQSFLGNNKWDTAQCFDRRPWRTRPRMGS